jgi:hypothetical protein
MSCILVRVDCVLEDPRTDFSSWSFGEIVYISVGADGKPEGTQAVSPFIVHSETRLQAGLRRAAGYLLTFVVVRSKFCFYVDNRRTVSGFRTGVTGF